MPPAPQARRAPALPPFPAAQALVMPLGFAALVLIAFTLDVILSPIPWPPELARTMALVALVAGVIYGLAFVAVAWLVRVVVACVRRAFRSG